MASNEESELNQENSPPPAAVNGYNKLTLEEAFFLYAHTAFVYGLFLCFSSAKWITLGFVIFLITLSVYGVKNVIQKTSNSKSRIHQLALVTMNALAFQNVAFGWLQGKPMTFFGLSETQQYDLKDDPILGFQKRYAIPLIGIMCFVIPTLLPIIVWNESLNNSWHVAVIFRYISSWDSTFMAMQKTK